MLRTGVSMLPPLQLACCCTNWLSGFLSLRPGHGCVTAGYNALGNTKQATRQRTMYSGTVVLSFNFITTEKIKLINKMLTFF